MKNSTAHIGLSLLGIMLTMIGCDQSAEETAEPVAPAAPATQPAEAAATQPAAEVVDFDQAGVLVQASSFFQAAAGKTAEQLVQPQTADRALVTATGVYAFWETPDNDGHLSSIESGSSVQIKGKLLSRGRLLHIDEATLLESQLDIDATLLSAAAPVPVTLVGTNQCMCGNKIKEMHTTCKLGHLHHLVTGDNKIYHYLQFADGQDAMGTMKYHFKDIEVTATELPGQFLLVNSIKIVTP